MDLPDFTVESLIAYYEGREIAAFADFDGWDAGPMWHGDGERFRPFIRGYFNTLEDIDRTDLITISVNGVLFSPCNIDRIAPKRFSFVTPDIEI